MQLTFREQWLDERLKFNDFNGDKPSKAISIEISIELSHVWIRRKDQVLDSDRVEPRVDAGLVLFEREGRPLPQHHHAKRLHSHLPLRLGALQHSVSYISHHIGARNEKALQHKLLIRHSLLSQLKAKQFDFAN